MCIYVDIYACTHYICLGKTGFYVYICFNVYYHVISIVSLGYSDVISWFYSKVMDVFIKAAEYMEIPVRRTDNEPLQKLFMLVRSELNLDLKNIKQEQAKFWKQHPSLVKVICSPSFGNIKQLKMRVPVFNEV